MITNRQLFFSHLAQTSPAPAGLEVERAEGIYLYDAAGNRYIDFISGVSVSNTGHRHPRVLEALQAQLDHYLHLMVYGEYIQSPQVKYAKALADCLPSGLSRVYFVNSGSEAIEGAMKLAKRHTGRSEVIAFRKAYHGSTQGALSIMGDEALKNPFRPLIPDITMLDFNDFEALAAISGRTACVVAEPVQAEAGVILPEKGFLRSVRERCSAYGALLVLDEVQTGFGRTGTLFHFEQHGITPDILVLAKALGGGMPLGAFIASGEVMSSLMNHPALGHITTFGGHPVCCAAGLASLEVILQDNLIHEVTGKAVYFLDRIRGHPLVKAVRHSGLLMALELENEALAQMVVRSSLQHGLILEGFLFNRNSLKMAPPLTITTCELDEAARMMLEAMDRTLKEAGNND